MAKNKKQTQPNRAGAKSKALVRANQVRHVAATNKHGGKVNKNVVHSRGGNYPPVVIRNCEFISQVTVPAGQAGAQADYTLNPGNSLLFPWLSPMALNFEEYKFRYLKLKFVSSLGANYRGMVYMAFDPDVDDPVYTSVQQLATSQYSCYTQVHESMEMNIPQRAMDTIGKSRYVQAEGSARTADAGRLYFWVDHLDSAITSNILVGNIMVEYEIELRVPQFRVNQLSREGYSRWADSVTSDPGVNWWKTVLGTDTQQLRLGELGAEIGTSWSGSSLYSFLNFPKAGEYLLTVAGYHDFNNTDTANFGAPVCITDVDTDITLVDAIYGDNSESGVFSRTTRWLLKVAEDIYAKNADHTAWGASPGAGTRPAYKDAIELGFSGWGSELTWTTGSVAMGVLIDVVKAGMTGYAGVVQTWDVEGRKIKISASVPPRAREEYLKATKRHLVERNRREPATPTPTEEFILLGVE